MPEQVSSRKGSPHRILVSGASGFVGTHVVNEFLGHGYEVVGTVRSEDSAESVRQVHSKYSDQLRLVIVKDITVSGAFDEAVVGVNGVIHTASPFVLTVKDNEEDLLKPAIQGTTGILTSIAKNNSSVRRVVITSSFAAMVDTSQGPRPGYTYSEKDWNPADYESGKKSDNTFYTYCASKSLAEKAAFDFVRDEKPRFDISTILPTMVYGPAMQQISDMSKLNASSKDIYRLIDGSEKEVPPTAVISWVDVRDVAKAHRLAYEKPEAGGQRYFTTASLYSFQQVVDIIRKDFPQLQSQTPRGTPGAGLIPNTFEVDDSKIKKELGMTFMPLEKSIHDMVEELLRIEKSIRE